MILNDVEGTRSDTRVQYSLVRMSPFLAALGDGDGGVAVKVKKRLELLTSRGRRGTIA